MVGFGTLCGTLNGTAAATTIAWVERFLDGEPGDGPVIAVITGRNVDQAVFDRVDALARADG